MGEIDRISPVVAAALEQVKRDRKSPKRPQIELHHVADEVEEELQEELTVSEQDGHIDLSA